MQYYRVPLTSVPQQLYIHLAGKEYQLTLKFLDVPEGGWVLDLDLPEGGGPVLHGLPLVTGADLLAPYAHLGIGGGLLVYGDDSDAAPGRDNLGQGVDYQSSSCTV